MLNLLFEDSYLNYPNVLDGIKRLFMRSYFKFPTLCSLWFSKVVEKDTYMMR